MAMDDPQTIPNPQVIRMHSQAPAPPDPRASDEMAERQPLRDYLDEMADVLISMGNPERIEGYLYSLSLIPPDQHVEEVKRRLINAIANINAARNAPPNTVTNYYLGDHTGQFLAGGNVIINPQNPPPGEK